MSYPPEKPTVVYVVIATKNHNHVVAGVFTDPWDATTCKKTMTRYYDSARVSQRKLFYPGEYTPA